MPYCQITTRKFESKWFPWYFDVSESDTKFEFYPFWSQRAI